MLTVSGLRRANFSATWQVKAVCGFHLTSGRYLNIIIGENEDLADPGDDAEPGAEGSKKRTKAHRPEATLAKNAAQLRTKKLELEFTVDPLFKKTCADFDESGAQGLLMNHLALGLGGSLRVVFDAGDSAGAGGTGEDGEDEPEEPEDFIDLSYLRSEYISVCAQRLRPWTTFQVNISPL